MSNDASNQSDLPDSQGSDPMGAPSARVCPQCGSVMESSQFGEACPACLVQVGFESDANTNGVRATKDSDEATQNDEDSPEAVQKLFPGLEILERIGHGGMGVVYKARQKHLGRLVALKLLRAKCSGDPSLAERFTREARALAKLSHPNIVGVHDFGQAGDRPFLIMEYVDGVNLRSMLESKTLNPVEAMAMVPAICEALQFAHDEGVVHRDIKPENILVDRRGRVRIADFGLARLMSRSKEEWTLTGTRQVMGTPHYMAPEQIERPQEVDHRADIYSLGVVIYEMLTGELPIGRFELPSNKINVDIRFDDIVLRTLEKEPVRRYQHVTEVQTAVEKIASAPSHPGATFSWASSMTSNLGEPKDVFLRIAALGVFAAAIVDVGVALTMLADSLHRLSWDLILGGTYHAIVAGVLGTGGWQMLNQGSKHWMLTALLAIVPIHFGVLGALPFAGLYLLLFLLGFRNKSTEHLLQKVAEAFPSKSQSVQQGVAIVLSSVLNQWKRISAWLVATWPVLWRKAFRALLVSCLWLAFCAIASLSLYGFYGRSHFPTLLHISDHSANSTLLSNSDDIRMRIGSQSIRSHVGHTILPEDLKRSHIDFALYLAADRPDLRPRNVYSNPPPRIYMSQVFHAYLTKANAIEYELLFPEIAEAFVVEPIAFKSKPVEDAKSTGNGYVTNQRLGSSQSRPFNKLQYRPQLTNPKPIEEWLASSGMTGEQAAENAEGIYGLLLELSRSGGLVSDSQGENRLRPISDMLDKELFVPQTGSRVYIDLTIQQRAIDAWVGFTLGIGVLGLLVMAILQYLRLSRTRKENGGQPMETTRMEGQL